MGVRHESLRSSCNRQGANEREAQGLSLDERGVFLNTEIVEGVNVSKVVYSNTTQFRNLLIEKFAMLRFWLCWWPGFTGSGGRIAGTASKSSELRSFSRTAVFLKLSGCPSVAKTSQTCGLRCDRQSMGWKGSFTPPPGSLQHLLESSQRRSGAFAGHRSERGGLSSARPALQMRMSCPWHL